MDIIFELSCLITHFLPAYTFVPLLSRMEASEYDFYEFINPVGCVLWENRFKESRRNNKIAVFIAF